MLSGENEELAVPGLATYSQGTNLKCPGFHMSQTIGDFAVSRPSQILPIC